MRQPWSATRQPRRSRPGWALAPALLLLLASACSDDSQPSLCGADCMGCCSKTGSCQKGTSSTACGSGGESCQSCTSGKKCINGACQMPTCDPSTCSGCCLSGSCVELASQSEVSCGINGAACSTCPSGSSCVNGSCQTTTCGPGTCTGCCASATQCLLFTQQNAASCGKTGAACATCPGGTQCIEGTCGGCNSSNCTGCCTSTGQCLLFVQQSAAACGSSGSLCSPCSTQCLNGICQGTTCTAATCPAGCCQGTNCIPFAQQTNLLCGKTGAACQSCGTFNCADGACGDNWKLGVVSCVVSNKPSGDWDPIGISGKAPDPMVHVTVKASNVNGVTAFVNDTLTPSFNQDVLTDSITNLTHPQGIVAEIRDDDSPIGFEVMGQCSAVLTQADLLAGSKTISGCTAQAVSVTLRFSK